ncbi:MAG: hypothetical protein D3924_16250, partial [Candidatus Electrothrix sp. AR4]|nr:hypothetical protein [Candidatus Electrothrix sp. AR4]
MSNERFSVTITVQPWFRDHFFAGRIILPAVETMLLLADWVAKAFPAPDTRVMEDMRFAKFLELPPEATRVEALIESAPSDDDCRIEAKLLSRIPCGTMSRIKEHGVMSFPLPTTVPVSSPVSQVDP